MAIIAFTGTPGSGKTYDAVQKIIDNLQLGRTVYTNIRGMDNPLCLEMIKGYCGLSDYFIAKNLIMFEEEQIVEFWQHIKPRSVVVIDEVQNYFGSREWQSDKNKDFGRWASTHRHYGFEVIIITQNIERVDSAVRGLIEWSYNYRKVNFFGNLVKKSYMCYAYGGDDSKGKPLTTSKRVYNDQIFLCYKSYVSDDIKEMGLMAHANVLKHPVFYAIPLVLIFTIYMVFFKSSIGSGDLFGSEKAMATIESTRKKPNHPVRQTPVQDSYSKNSPSIQKIEENGLITFTNRSGYVRNQ